MKNAHAVTMLSLRTKSLLRLHAKAIGVGALELASELFEMMMQDVQSLHRTTLVPEAGASR